MAMEITFDPAVRPVRNGFDPDDVHQEGAIGIFVANRQRPGDRWFARRRAVQRIARWRRKERNWNVLRVSIMEHDKPRAERLFESILVRELLDLLPYTVREEVLEALLSNDGKRINRAGRLVREAIPNIEL